jgi:hypothetical protein
MTGKSISYAVLAGLFVLAVPVAASADDLQALCRIGNPFDGGDKICRCVSDRISGPDRVVVIKVMRFTNDAMTKGTSPDPSTWTDDMIKAMSTIATVEARCMQ